MRQLRTVILLVLVLFWAPLTVHCQIELISGWELLGCQTTHSPAEASGTHCDDECCSLEVSHYQLPDIFHGNFDLVTVFVAELPPLDEPESLISGVVLPSSDDQSPPWHCRFLLSVPVRGPSVS